MTQVPPAKSDIPEAIPSPSMLSVDGAVPMFWDSRTRTLLARFTEIAAEFGLKVVETPIGPDQPRRTWSWHRVDLEHARLTFVQWPGIGFDDWTAELWGINADQRETKAAKRAAKAKAKVALSRLNADGKVAKRRHPVDGRLLLFAPSAAPATVDTAFVPPVPPGLAALRAQGVRI